MPRRYTGDERRVLGALAGGQWRSVYQMLDQDSLRGRSGDSVEMTARALARKGLLAREWRDGRVKYRILTPGQEALDGHAEQHERDVEKTGRGGADA
jgi:hypothetical protein